MGSEKLAYAAASLGVDLVVQLNAESILLSFADDIAPTLPLISGDWEEVHLAYLRDTYRIFDDVIARRRTISEAIAALSILADRDSLYNRRLLVFIYGITCACIGPLAFGARIIDIPIIFLFGCCIGLLKKLVEPHSKHKDVLDVLAVVCTSFCARALGSLSGGQFCFSALAQAPLVLLLPGFTVGNSKPATKNSNFLLT